MFNPGGSTVQSERCHCETPAERLLNSAGRGDLARRRTQLPGGYLALTCRGSLLNVSGVWNCDFLYLCFAALNGHHGKCDLLIEPVLAAASRIQPEDATDHLLADLWE